MKLSNLIAIIAIAAVLVFFIITYAFPGAPAWLVFIAAGLGMAIASAVMKDDKSENAPKEASPKPEEDPEAK